MYLQSTLGQLFDRCRLHLNLMNGLVCFEVLHQI